MMVQRFFVVVLAFALAATDSQNPSKEGYYGQLFIDEERSKVGAGPVAQPPSPEHLLRTDVQGRDVLADVVYGTPATLRLGLIAGVLGVAAGNARVGRWVGPRRAHYRSLSTDSIACPAREALDRWRSLLLSGCRRCRSRACSASVSVSAGLRDRSRWPIR